MKALLCFLLFFSVPAYAGGNCIFHKSFVVEPGYVEIEAEAEEETPPAMPTDVEEIILPEDINPTDDEEEQAEEEHAEDEEPPATQTEEADGQETQSDLPTAGEQTNPPADDNPSQTGQLDDEVDGGVEDVVDDVEEVAEDVVADEAEDVVADEAEDVVEDVVDKEQKGR